MIGYCWDAYYIELALEYEATGWIGQRRAISERPFPLHWVMAWLGGLSAISLGLGSLLQWPLQ